MKTAHGISAKLALLPVTERDAITAGLNELRAGTESVEHAYASAPDSVGRTKASQPYATPWNYAGGASDATPTRDPNEPACSTYLLFGGVQKYYLALLEAFYADHAPTKASRAAGEAAACARLGGKARAELLGKIATSHGVSSAWRQPSRSTDAEDPHSNDVKMSYNRDGDSSTGGLLKLHRLAADSTAPAPLASEGHMGGTAASGTPALLLDDYCGLRMALKSHVAISRMTIG